MKLAKRSLVVLASTACMTGMVFTGCGSSSSSTQSAASPKASESAAASTDTSKEAASPEAATSDKAYVADTDLDLSEPVTITWYTAGASEPEDMQKVLAEANRYIAEETNLNCTLDLKIFDFGTYEDKIMPMIASGENFDICFTCNWSNDYNTQAAKGAYVALNDEKDLLSKYAPKTKELLGEDFLSGSRINGINYAIPANKEKAHQWGLLVRTDMIEKYKMDLSNVKSLADMEPFFQTIKENEPSMYALEAVEGESSFRLLDFDRIGADNYPGVVYNDSADMKVFNELETPEAMDFFKLMHKYYQAGYVREDAATINDYTVDQKAGKIFAATRSLKPGKDAEESLSMGVPYTQIELTQPVISNRETTGSMQAISITSEHPERALLFMDLFNSDQYFNNLINFGIEGEHYEKVSDTAIKEGPTHDKYSLSLGWAFGNQFLNYVWDGKEAADKWDKFLAFNDAGVKTKTLGFVYDPSNVTTEIGQCVNVWQQYMPSLETGTVDPEEVLPKALEEFKAAGVDTIIADKQQQLDTWAAAQK